MKLPHDFWLAATILSAFSPSGLQAQDPVLIREVVSREISIHVGGVETTPQKEIVSREVSISVENGSSDLVHEISSREYDVLVDNPGPPPAVNEVIVTISPTGESVTLDWFVSNPWATRDIQRFDIYLSGSAPITDITGLTPYASVGGDTTRLTLDGLTAYTDHYFTIVAVDGLGNRLTTVPYHAGYVLSPEVVSREVSLYIGQEPDPPYKQVVSREYDLAIDKPGPPPAIGDVLVSLSPSGDTATLDWSSYNQWAVGDVQRFDIYLSDSGPFADVTGMTPFASIGGGSTGIQLTGLAQLTDHYFAVVPVDALGNRIPQVSYSAGYVLMPELVSREVSLFIGQEPVPPYREIVSREVSIVVSDGTTPAPVTGIDSGFSAVTSVGLFGAIDLDWKSYNELAQKDVSRYRVYLSETYFESVTGMEPHSFIQTGRQTATIDGFPSAAIRYVAVVAEDASGNFNPVVRAHSVQASYLPYFRFFDQTVPVFEGMVADISLELEGFIDTGRYQLAADSAHAFDGSTGDYVDAPVPLKFKFNPKNGKYEANIQIPIIRDNVTEPNEEFVVLVINPNEGSTTVVASARVVVKDASLLGGGSSVWHPEIQAVPAVPAVPGNHLAVDLNPAVPDARWRLVGEPFWREPGSANLAGPLATGRHRVEYKPVFGFGMPEYVNLPWPAADIDPRTYVFPFNEPNSTHVIVTTYPVAPSPSSGTLRVDLEPAAITSAPDESNRGQWRLVGETVWQNHGSAVSLPVGKHLVEFKDSLAGYHAPVPRSVVVSAGFQTFIQEKYVEAGSVTAGVSVLPFTGVPGSGHVNAAPQNFVGQIETGQGYGTGIATSAHTVLTAARVVYDPERLAGATDIAWFHQRHADYGADVQDDNIPEVQYPRGYKILTSYASQRASEVVGSVSPAAPGDAPSDQKDIAVLYFTGENGTYISARGGSSGFLADFSYLNRPNPWLTGTAEKRLCGYPLSGVPEQGRGLMHASGIVMQPCESYGGFLYRGADLAGLPGMEGAPLLVKHPNGSIYPAAVYLGQNHGAVFRALDRYVAAAIYLAEWEAEVYSNLINFRTGSGGEYVSRWAGDETVSGFLYVDFTPSQGSWKLLDPSGPELTGWLLPGQRVSVPAGNYLIQYQDLNGFKSPSLQFVSALPGLTSPVTDVSYQRTYLEWAKTYFSTPDLDRPEISGPEARLNDLPNLVAFGFGLEPGSAMRPVARPDEKLPGLPKVTIDPVTSPPTIVVDFMRRNPALAPELVYIIEFADSPAGDWADAPTSPEITRLDDEWDQVRLISAPVANAGRKFVRVRVERTSQ